MSSPTRAVGTERPMGLPGRALLLVLLVAGLLLVVSSAFTTFFYVCYGVVGALLVMRRPRNVIGWLLVLIAYGFAGIAGVQGLDTRALQDGTASWADFLAVWATAWAGYATFGGMVALTVLFPTGRLPAGRWRWPAIALLGGCAAVTVVGAVAPTIAFNPDGGVTTVTIVNRLALLPGLAAWSLVPLDALIAPVIAFLAIGVVSMIVRYRHSTGIERLQLRWLVAAVTFVVLAVTAGLTAILILGDDAEVAWLPAAASFPMIPAAIYVAITRYRLYEIDRIVSRTIGWVVVTVLLAAVFAMTIIGLQAVLAPITENNTLAVAASTLLAASLFQPLRARVQQAVDRRFNRGRVDAKRVTEGFATHVRDTVDLLALRERLLAAVDGTVQPSGSAIWIRGAER